nr:MAG TPA: hypothetical protein [Caudoviricetes sp.]
MPVSKLHPVSLPSPLSDNAKYSILKSLNAGKAPPVSFDGHSIPHEVVEQRLNFSCLNALST